VADVLQRLIRRAWSEGLLSHPIYTDSPCPVLQFADDTLIICKANQGAATFFKKVLEDFVGICNIENKKNPTARTNNMPRSNLVAGSNEVKINIPSKTAKH
jgi:hypothetical protein